MERICRTSLWNRTLGLTGEGATDTAFRRRLANSFETFRRRAETLSGEIAGDLKQLTVHDITHIDALWETTDLIIGNDYLITTTEAFVLGCAFLLHDLGLALASYPDGICELKQDPTWRDAVVRILRRNLGRAPRSDEVAQPDSAVEQHATEEALRVRHAQHAVDLATVAFQRTPQDPAYYLLEDPDLRENYGRLIGRVAYSHWWPIERVVADAELNRTIGAFPEGPADWSIHPLKLALILRTADACQVDARRAPGFIKSLRKPTGTADLHWRAQSYLQQPIAKNCRLEFTSTKPFSIADRDAWWVAFDLLQLADRELRDAEAVLSETGLPVFAVHGVAGCESARQLARFIPTDGWTPVDTSVRSTDVASLVKKIGGEGLYGKNPAAALRELIQNARDAVVGARIKTNRNESWGQITVRLVRDAEAYRLDIDDNGLGMSRELLSGPFLDFGASYWDSLLSSEEHPGLVAGGFEPQGQFGVGFFSVFMLGDRVRVITRRLEDSIDQTRVLEFEAGLGTRPILRDAKGEERRLEPGTCVSTWLRVQPGAPHGILRSREYPTQPIRDHGSRRKSPWQLSELCLWLCPALDVDLFADTDGTVEKVLQASDWRTISTEELLRRLMLDRDDCDEPATLSAINTLIPNIQEVRNAEGHVIGRVALTNWADAIRKPDGGYTRVPGVITAGCFRALGWELYPGLLIGRPTVVARSQASPIIFDYPEELANWATCQAALVHTLTHNVCELAEYAQLIRLLNGDTADLPIAERAGRILSFRDIAGLTDLPDEVELYDALWLVQPDRIGQHGQSPNSIGVSSGRMRPGYAGPRTDSDFRCRADHPRWRQYWMSLWGATMEAIAIAWGCRLQDVLEASTIHRRGHEEMEIDGRKVHRELPDVIRKPS